ncbi:hypothetical protein CL622_03080 [archaeon]|nr:hypothetical protein [archaeon]|tara:strand:- start:946 stop:1440 length:495 start_codon:yes stop_codon:yes gene_type:complete
MKYLAYFKPNKEISDLILRRDNIVLPKSGLHSTLCFFDMEPKHEQRLVSDLSNIEFYPFEIQTLGYENFDEDQLVLTLSRPDRLLGLHNNVVSTVQNYSDRTFDEIVKKYYRDNYNPHLAISKSSIGFNRNPGLIGQKYINSRYYLAKKIRQNWKEIQSFRSNR